MFLSMGILSMAFLGIKTWCPVILGNLSKIELYSLVDWKECLSSAGGSGLGSSKGFAIFRDLLWSSGSCHSSSVHDPDQACGWVSWSFLRASFLQGRFAFVGEVFPKYPFFLAPQLVMKYLSLMVLALKSPQMLVHLQLWWVKFWPFWTGSRWRKWCENDGVVFHLKKNLLHLKESQNNKKNSAFVIAQLPSRAKN